jgi:hypothetical protein
MMSESTNRIMNANPSKLADALGLGSAPARVWLPDELGAVFQHQMAAPVSVDLAAIGPESAALLRMLADAQGLLLKSFHDLFEHPQPPVELLQLVKDFAKMNRDRTDSLLPNEVATVLYFLSIAAALVKLARRITTLSDPELRQGFQWCSSQRWIDAPARSLIEDASKLISPKQSAP